MKKKNKKFVCKACKKCEEDYFKNATDKDVIELAHILYDSVCVAQCYNVKDIIILDAAISCLEKRGYIHDCSMEFRKEEAEE